MRNENVIKINTSFRPSSPRRNVVRGIGAALTLYPAQKHCGMTECEYRHGFTLIELLVIVLIIGILAAGALPRYQVAVAKSRLTHMVQILNTFKTAEEIYFMDNNAYTDNSQLLDIDFSLCPPRAEGSDVLICNEYFMLDPIERKSENNLKAFYCPKDVLEKNGSTICAENADFTYTVWLANSSHPNQITCEGKTDFGKRVCRSFK